MWQGRLQTTFLHADPILASFQDFPFSFGKTSLFFRRTYGCSPVHARIQNAAHVDG